MYILYMYTIPLVKYLDHGDVLYMYSLKQALYVNDADWVCEYFSFANYI